jgi:hypothetical protein
MTKTLPYNSQNIQMIFDNLKHVQAQGKARDFEIRIDDFTTVQRTSDLSQFHCYQNALRGESSEVSFILYKGNSRRYDKYVLIRKKPITHHNDQSTQAYIESRVKEAVEEHKRKLEHQRLKEENKSQKERIKELKQRVADLEAKDKGDLKSLLELAKGYFQKPTPEQTAQSVSGIDNQELAEMITHFKTKFGDQVVEKALGIGLQVAEHPELIEEVKEFINQKLSHENK